MRASLSASFSWAALACAALLLTACGNKPDGTPYGVDPTKTTAGRQAAATRDSARRRPHDAIGMPKGAEVNAVTSGARAGTPPASMPQ
ncbi:hypothetical protein [Hymenobacter arcticus]